MSEFANIWRDLKQPEPENDVSKIKLNAMQDIDPDRAAKQLDMAEQTGLPIETVRSKEADIWKRMETEKFDASRIKNQSPSLAKLMENPSHAPIVKPDVDKMWYIERLYRDVAQSAEQGLGVNEYGDIGMKRLISGDESLTGEEKLTLGRFREREIVDYKLGLASKIPGAVAETGLQLGTFAVDAAPAVATSAAVGAGVGFVGGNATGIGLVLPEELVTVPGGALFGASRAAPIALAYQAFNAEAGGAFNEYVDTLDDNGEKIEREVAQGAAVVTGVVNGALEYAGGKVILKNFPGMDKLFSKFGRESIKEVIKTTAGRESMKRIAAAFASSAVIEGGTEGLQEVVNVVIGEAQKLASDKEFQDIFGNVAVPDGNGGTKEVSFAEYTADAALQAAERGALGGGGVSAIGQSITIGTESVLANRQHKRDQKVIEDRKTLLRDLELGKRSPKIVKQFLENMPAEDYYLSAENVKTFFQDEARLNEFFSKVPAAAEQYADAIEAGGDLVIPHEQMDQLWVDTSETKQFDGLQEFLKREPTAMTDAEMEQRINEEIAGYELPDNTDLSPAERLEQRVESDILNLKNRRVNSPTAAKLYASLFRNTYETYAQRIGENPELDSLMNDLFDRIQIKDGDKNQKLTKADSLDILLNRIRQGGTKPLPNESLLDFVRKKGGISTADQLAGDIAQLDPDVTNVARKDGKGNRLKAKAERILREGGQTLDDLAVAAWEAGYFPEFKERPDLRVLVGAIEDELRGQPRFVQNDEANQNQQRLDEEALFAEELGRLGIDIASPNAEIKRQIEEAQSRPQLPADIDAAFQAASEQYDIDFDAIVRIAQIESTIDPNAKNPNSSAGGLFQFIDSTAKQYGLKDKFNVEEATDAFARLFNDNRNSLRDALDREPTNAELYLAHQQGAGGAINLLSNPDKLAKDIVGEDAVRLNGGNLNMTAREFAGLWINKYNKKEAVRSFAQDNRDDRDLVAQHNLSLANLEAADKVGGLAVPSIAITRKGDPFDNFGEITLVGDADLIDPQRSNTNKVFAADVYSPRYPRPEYVLKTDDFNEQVRNVNQLNGDLKLRSITNLAENIERDGITGIISNSSVQLAYLQEKGKTPEIPYQEKKQDIVDLYPELKGFTSSKDYQSLARDPEFVAAIKAVHEKMINDFDDPKRMRKLLTDDNGEPNFNILIDRARSVVSHEENAQTKVDDYALERRVREVIENDDGFESWVKEKFSGVIKDERIFNGYTPAGNRKYLPHNLQNVVKLMKRGLQDGEGFNYGLGSVRSKFAPKFKSIKQIRAAKDKLVSDAEFEAIKKEMDDEFIALAEELRPYSPMKNEFGYYDAFSEHLKEIADVGNVKRVIDEYYAGVPDEVIANVGDFLVKLRDMPTEYFEAKIQRAVDLGEFKGALVPEGKKYDKAVEILKRSGIENIERYPEEGGRASVIDKLSQLFFQKDKDKKRGSVTFDAPNMQTIIEVFDGGDLSTILHETGHVFLEMQRIIATQDNAPQQIKDDYAKILEWLGVDDGSKIETEHHEKFARGFEAYLFEGNAPSLELKNAFARFKSWLVSVYKNIANLDVKLTNEVRGVFDRMLATDEAIEQIRSQSTFRPNPEMADILTKAEYEAYVKLYNRSMDQAKEDLLKQALKEMRNRDREWWKNESAALRKEIESTVNTQPIHRAVHWLRTGEDFNTKNPVTLDPVRLRKVDIRDDYDAGYIDALPRGTVAASGGIHPQLLADYMGFDDAQTMLDQMANYVERKDVIEDLVEQEMIRRHGDMLFDNTMAEKAELAVENKIREKNLFTELQAVSRKAKTKAATSAAYKDQAYKMIDGKPLNKLRPNDYYRAEVRYAREAGKHLKAKDYVKAAEAKRKELLNHHLYKAATDARRMRDKLEKYVKRFGKDSTRASIDKESRDQIDGILQRFGLYSNAKLQKTDVAFSDYAKAREADGDIVYAPPIVLGQGSDYRQLSVEDVRDVFQTIRNVEALGREQRDILVGAEKLTAAEAREKAIESILENNEQRVRVDKTDGYYNKLKKNTRNIINNVTRIEFIVKEMDGGKVNGATHQAVINPLRKAAGERYAMLRKYRKQMGQILDANPDVKKWGKAKLYTLEDGRQEKMNKSQVVMIALNMGNQGNMKNLTHEDGHNYSERDIDMFKAELSKSDWDTVQQIWDMFESLRPDIERVNQKMTNLDMKVVQAEEVVTPYGTYRGGYMPIVYDPEGSFVGARNEESVQVNESNFEIPSVGRGFTKKRSNFAAQVLLDFDGVIQGHLHETIQFITHAQAIRQVNRITSHKDFRDAVNSTFGTETVKEFRPWLSSVARDAVYDSPVTGLDKFLRHLRVGTSTIYLGFSTGTGFKQILGLSSTEAAVARGDLKQKHYLRAMRDMATKPQQTTEFAFEHSKMMRERFEGVDADTSLIYKTSKGKGAFSTIQRAGFAPIVYTQVFAVDIPTWQAGYLEGLERHDGNHEQAVNYADAILSQTQGSGTVMDLARVQRGSEGMKAVAAMFGTYMIGVLTPMMRQAYRDSAVRKKHTKAALTLIPMIVLPALLEAYMSGDEPEDDETWAEWALLNSALYGVSAVPVLGGIGASLYSDYDYQLSPISSAINTVQMGYRDVKDGDPGKAAVRGAAVAIGLTFKLPTYHPYKLIDEIVQIQSGEDEASFRELFLGAPDDENR